MTTLTEETSVDTFELNYEQTVPRSLVHKRSIENVLLTEVRSVAEDRFICAGRIPTAHRFFNDAQRAPRQDILFYTELGRQASLAVSHAFLGTSREDVFIFEQSQAVLTEAAWKSASEGSPDSVVTEIKIHEMQRRKNNAVAKVVAEHVMTIGRQEVFRGTGSWSMQPFALFQRLRRMAGTRGTSPANVAQRRDAGALPDYVRCGRADNVVIAQPEYFGDRDEFVTSLIVDDTHPYFFDHACDHIPGMLLLEGCAQFALAAFGKVTAVPPKQLAVRAYEVNFVQFVECGQPITLTAQLNNGPSPAAAHISISQQDVVCGTATMAVAVLI